MFHILLTGKAAGYDNPYEEHDTGTKLLVC